MIFDLVLPASVITQRSGAAEVTVRTSAAIRSTGVQTITRSLDRTPSVMDVVYSSIDPPALARSSVCVYVCMYVCVCVYFSAKAIT